MSDKVHLPCSQCGSVNRVPNDRLGEHPICGECKSPLVGGKPAELDGSNFDSFLEASDLPVVVDFWAQWCSPCLQMAPHYEKASGELAGVAVLAKLDTDAHPQIAGRYAIRGIPLLIMFKGGKEHARQVGAMPAPRIVEWVQSQV